MSTLEELGLSRISVHEAGHATVAMYYDLYVSEITNIPNADLCSLGNIRYSGGLDSHFTHSVIHLAGEVAVAFLGGQPDWVVMGSRDCQDVARFYFSNGGDPEGYTEYLKSALGRAAGILRQPRMAALLLLLAQWTEQKSVLTVEDIKEARRRVRQIPYSEIEGLIQ